MLEGKGRKFFREKPPGWARPRGWFAGRAEKLKESAMLLAKSFFFSSWGEA
jgi:hypothetical protein